MQTLELQSLLSVLKGFQRGVSWCLPVPPAPGRSAIVLGHFTPLPPSLRKRGVPVAGAPAARLPTGAAGVALHHGLLDSCLSTGDTQRGPSA